MAKAILTLLLFFLGWLSGATGQGCDPPFVDVGGQCLYVYLDARLTWQDASNFCSELAGDQGGTTHLAMFPTCDSFSAFTRYLELNYGDTQELWVGARSTFTSNMWFWENGDPLQTGVPYWTYLETYQEGEDCAASDGAYYYRFKPALCNSPKGIVCAYSSATARVEEVTEAQPEEKDVCPGDSILIGNICYVFKHEEHDWAEAEKKCGEEHEIHGGMLFYPETCEEFARVAHHMQTIEEVFSYWAGAIDVTGDEDWTWVDGMMVPGGTPYWAAGEPSHSHDNMPREHCGLMSSDKDYYLSDTHCTEKYRYLCKLTLV